MSYYKIILLLLPEVYSLKCHHQNIIPGIIDSFHDLWEPHKQTLQWVCLQCQGVNVELICNARHLLLHLLLAGLQLILELLDSGASPGQFYQTLLHLFPSNLEMTTNTIKKCFNSARTKKRKDMSFYFLNITLQCLCVFVYSTSKRLLTDGNSLSSSVDMSSRWLLS